MKWSTLVIGAAVATGLLICTNKVEKLYNVSMVEDKYVTIEEAPSRLKEMGYVASSSNAIYMKGDDVLYADDQSFYADDRLSETSNMVVYGDIQLGDSEEEVIKYYGDSVFDLGRGKLYARYLQDGKVIYVGTLDGKVIHTEVTYVQR